MSKLHDNLTFSSEVTEVLVKQLLPFSKQWIKKSFECQWNVAFQLTMDET